VEGLENPYARYGGETAINIAWADGHASTYGGIRDIFRPKLDLLPYSTAVDKY
jgi:prepilin-type processing-associated H-X9-DG protein